MTSATNKEWTDYIGVSAGGEDRKITVQVPDGLLDSLEISTTNEDITLPELAVTGSVSLSSNGGSVRFALCPWEAACACTSKTGTSPAQ